MHIKCTSHAHGSSGDNVSLRILPATGAGARAHDLHLDSAPVSHATCRMQVGVSCVERARLLHSVWATARAIMAALIHDRDKARCVQHAMRSVPPS